MIAGFESFHFPAPDSMLELTPSPGEQPARCPVHGREMKGVHVTFRGGKPKLDERRLEYSEIASMWFPNCDDDEEGGCLTGDGVIIKDVCQDCNAARDKWLQNHSSVQSHMIHANYKSPVARPTRRPSCQFQ